MCVRERLISSFQATLACAKLTIKQSRTSQEEVVFKHDSYAGCSHLYMWAKREREAERGRGGEEAEAVASLVAQVFNPRI